MIDLQNQYGWRWGFWVFPQQLVVFSPTNFLKMCPALLFFFPGHRSFPSGNVPTGDQTGLIGIGDLMRVVWGKNGSTCLIPWNHMLGIVLIKDHKDADTNQRVNTLTFSQRRLVFDHDHVGNHVQIIGNFVLFKLN